MEDRGDGEAQPGAADERRHGQSGTRKLDHRRRRADRETMRSL
jgi:hypothetical protein